MPERLMLALLDRAEGWANRAGNTLARRLCRGPQARRAGAAAEVFDLIGATPEGCVLMAELGLNPEAGALPTHDALAARYAEHRARVTDAAVVAGGGV